MSREAFELRGVSVVYPRGGVEAAAVLDVDLSIARGEIHALAGESGSGKSSLALAFLGLARAPGRIARGRAACDGREFDASDERAWAPLRGRTVSLMLQESSSALDPLQRVERQLRAAIPRSDERGGPRARSVELLEHAGFDEPEAILASYPHELSGGMRQRAQLALALAPRPRFLVADEPTANLDALLARQILATLRELADREGLGVLWVTHDLAAAADVADRISVMYAGSIAESGPTRAVLASPQHPYTEALANASAAREPFEAPLRALEGLSPEPERRPPGCAFAPRCAVAEAECASQRPALVELGARRLACPPRAREVRP